jgi:hypothetical protein
LDTLTPKRTSSLNASASTPVSVKRSSVSSLLDRTRSATLGRLAKRNTQTQEQPPMNGFLHSIYDDDDDEEPIPKAPKLTSEYFRRYEIMTEL